MREKLKLIKYFIQNCFYKTGIEVENGEDKYYTCPRAWAWWLIFPFIAPFVFLGTGLLGVIQFCNSFYTYECRYITFKPGVKVTNKMKRAVVIYHLNY